MITINNEDFNIEKIALSGQCFRLNKVDDSWINVVGDKVLKIKNNDLYCSKRDFDTFWKPYFDLESDYSFYRHKIPKSDKFLTAAAEYGKGIRILKQDPWEMLISFIISQRKSIPAIKSSIEALSKNYGEEIGETCEGAIYSFPKVEKLVKAKDSTLSKCGLGYRVEYIKTASKMVADGKLDLNALYKLSDEDLLNELLKVKGVGIKVANCVSLFAYHRIDAFPIDVWIARALEDNYNNNFSLKRYEGFAGVIQQYMFFYKRNNG